MPMLNGYDPEDLKKSMDYIRENYYPDWITLVMEYEKALQLQELNKNLVELTKVLKGKDMQGR